MALAACGGSPPADAGPDAPALDAPPVPLDANAAVGDWVGFDPAAPGPFAVGYRSFEHTYTPPGHTEPRTIEISLWYPTLVPDGESARYSGIYTDPEVVANAPLAPSIYDGGRYPVHVYSHGDRGYGGTSAFLMRRFASHGWVAVAPDHTGNTLDDNLMPRPVWMYYVRSTDLTAALDAVGALPATDPLSGVLMLDAVVASGHSYGTHTMWASAGASFDVAAFGDACVADGTCTMAERDAFAAGVGDPRIVAIVPMAGAISRTYFGPTGHQSVTIPILSLTGTADPVGQAEQYATTAPLPMIWVDVEGACHQFFALGCPGDADGDEDLVVGGFALAFARAHVLTDTSVLVASILDGTRVLSVRAHHMAR
jgi:predicted dienelactone hydrolase